MTTEAISNPKSRPSITQLLAVPVFVTVVTFLIWLMMADSPLLHRDAELAATRGLSSRWDLYLNAVGIGPWIAAVYFMQLLWAAIPGLSGYFLADEKRARAGAARAVAVLAFVFLFLEVSNIGGWLRQHPALANRGTGYFGEVLATLSVGFIACLILVKGLQKLGPGHGFGIALLLMTVMPIARRLGELKALFVDSGALATTFWILFYLAVTMGLIAFVVWAHDKRVELPPQTLETRTRELATVYVSFGFLGLLPYWIAFLALGLGRSLTIGMRSELHLHGGWLECLGRGLSPESWVGTFLLAVLIWIGTYLAFRLLYPFHRLAKVLGRQERDVSDFFRPWLDSQLALYALYLIAILFTTKLFLAKPLAALGMGPMSLVLMVATLMEVRDGFWRQVSHEAELGPLGHLTTAMGTIEAEIVKTRLQREGVPVVLRPWTTQTVLPATVPGMGEIDVLIPETHAARAKEILG